MTASYEYEGSKEHGALGSRGAGRGWTTGTSESKGNGAGYAYNIDIILGRSEYSRL